MDRAVLVRVLLEHRHLFAGVAKGRAIVACSCGANLGAPDDEYRAHSEHQADALIAAVSPAGGTLF